MGLASTSAREKLLESREGRVGATPLPPFRLLRLEPKPARQIVSSQTPPDGFLVPMAMPEMDYTQGRPFSILL